MDHLVPFVQNRNILISSHIKLIEKEFKYINALLYSNEKFNSSMDEL